MKLNILKPKITFYESEAEPIKEKTMVNGKINIPGMINDLCYNFARTFEIIKIIREKYKENRKILVLSDRRQHCNDIKKLLGDDYSVGLYLGGMKNEALQESNTKRIIIATYSMASEGYDNADLDTLILATPKSKVEQAVGRILRKENENEPEVIDIIDTYSVFYHFYNKRKKFYITKKFIEKEKPKQEVELEKYSFIE